MATKIDWADESWNVTTGCTKCSPGCRNCYAERMSKRLAGRCGYPSNEPFRVTLHPDRLEQPLHWRKPRRVFVVSMGDLFHKDVPFEYILQIFDVMRIASHHRFLLLTKRPARMNAYYEWETERRGIQLIWPGHIWAGVTVESQAAANERIPLLLQVPAVVHWVSAEPMLGPIDIDRAEWGSEPRHGMNCFGFTDGFGYEACLQWIVAGTESGPHRRPAQLDWFRGLRDQCVAAGVPFFLKQMEIDGKVVHMPALDGVVWDQMPND